MSWNWTSFASLQWITDIEVEWFLNSQMQVLHNHLTEQMQDKTLRVAI